MPSIPKTMRAFVLTGHGGFDKLVWHEDWPTPEPGDDDVLIRVRACGLNNTDVNTRSGWYSKTVIEATTGKAHDDVGRRSKLGRRGATTIAMASRHAVTAHEKIIEFFIKRAMIRPLEREAPFREQESLS